MRLRILGDDLCFHKHLILFSSFLLYPKVTQLARITRHDSAGDEKLHLELLRT